VEETGDTELNEFKKNFFFCSMCKLHGHVGRELSGKLVLVDEMKTVPSDLD